MNSKLILLFLFISTFSFAQFGVELGYHFGNAKSKIDVLGVSTETEASTNALALGVVYDHELSETLDLQPYLSFGIGEKVADKSNNAIGLGAGLHYYFNNRDGGIYAGPILGYSYSLADVDTNLVSKGVLGSGLVLGLDISEQFTLQTNYTFNLSNPSKVDGVKYSANSFGISVQYFFR